MRLEIGEGCCRGVRGVENGVENGVEWGGERNDACAGKEGEECVDEWSKF
ncbi:hypothetical protein [Bartonella quintana]|nr:hypothetical protein [Bartonella quintana]